MKRSVLNIAASSFIFCLALLISSSTLLAQEQITKPVNTNGTTWAPFKMISFEAYLENSVVNLNWSKVVEENTNSFIVERSTDGKNFKEIAVVFGDDKNNISSFFYKDPNVSSKSGIIFYRLKYVDEVNRLYYSETRLIRLTKSTESLQLSSFPNPVMNELRITLPNNWQGKSIMIEIYSEYGVRIQAKQLSNASQTETLTVTSLPRGAYFIKATYNSQSLSQRIIKS